MLPSPTARALLALSASLMGSTVLMGCRAGTVHAAPRPVDPVSDEWEEEDGRERKAWLDELHGSAPGVDWRAVERARDEAERLRRSALRAGGGHRAKQANIGEWTEVGSRNQSGQTRCAALAPDGSLLLGSANGGLWRGSLDGTGWRPLSDDLGGGVDEVLAFLEADREVLLLRRGSDVFRSDSGGQEWQRASGLESLVRARRWVRTASGELLLYGTTEVDRGGRPGFEGALFASTNGGRSFVPRWRSAVAWDGDLALDEASGELLLLHAGGLLRSTDQGFRFGPLVTLTPGLSEGRIALAGSPFRRVFALVRADEDFSLLCLEPDGRVLDHGEIDECFGTVATLPGDEQLVFVGGMELWRSESAGSRLRRTNAWTDYYSDPLHALHADVRGFDSFRTAEGEAIALAHTDGGTYLSRNGGESWRNLCAEGLGVGQVYDTLSDAKDPRRVLLGTQDQGFQVGVVEASSSAGPSTDTEQLLSGDYAYLVSSDRRHGRVFASYPDFLLIADDGRDLDRSPWPRQAEHAWMPPLVADPNEAEACFLLAERIYRFRPGRGGRYGAQPFGQGRFDLGSANYLTAMAFAPSDSSRVVAADDAGGRHVSQDGGLTWRRAEDDGAAAEGFRPSVLAGHPSDASTFVIGGSGYGGPGVRLSTDGGRRWVDFSAGLPSTLVLDLAWWDADTLYAATEAGPWRWRRESGQWESVAGLAAPATTYWSVEALPDAGIVRFGTYGRGVWDLTPVPGQAPLPINR